MFYLNKNKVITQNFAVIQTSPFPSVTFLEIANSYFYLVQLGQINDNPLQLRYCSAATRNLKFVILLLRWRRIGNRELSHLRNE